MNLLPTMLIASTLIGANANMQTDLSAADINASQEKGREAYASGQVIIGTPSSLESILNNLGVNVDSILDCFRPSNPDSGDSDTGTGFPDFELPDNGTDIPDIELPGGGTDIPDIELPSPNPNPDTPGNGSTDTEQGTNQSYVEQVVALVNAERAKVNLPALTMSADLNAAAQIRAKETVQSFSHTRPNGSSFYSVLEENGISYRGAGENIAWGQRTPEAVVNAWMNSEGHRANILNKNFTSIGIGYYLNGSTPYWAQLFTY